MKGTKKRILWLVLALVVISLCIFFYHKLHKQSLPGFQKVSASEVLEHAKTKDRWILYVGSPECPDCVDFLPQLKQIIKEEELQVFYLQANDVGDPEDFQKIRDLYDVNSIPAILIFDGNKVYHPSLPDNPDDLKKMLLPEKQGE